MIPNLISQEISCESDDHVFLVIRRKDHNTISLDLTNEHGRVNLSVRSEGNGIASILCDMAPVKPKSNYIARYCSFCGEKLEVFSSRGHNCKE